jgi:hypothetical protein
MGKGAKKPEKALRTGHFAAKKRRTPPGIFNFLRGCGKLIGASLVNILEWRSNALDPMISEVYCRALGVTIYIDG